MGLRLIDGEVVEVGAKPHVTFFEHMEKKGIGKYKPVDYIAEKYVGQRDFMSRPVTDEDRERYPKEWAEYEAGTQKDLVCTPLSALPSFKSAFGLELEALGITTVQELAVKTECPIEGLEVLWKHAKGFVRALEEEDGEDSGQSLRQAG